MAGTYTTNLSLYKPETSIETGWGDLVNANFTTLDTAVGTQHDSTGYHIDTLPLTDGTYDLGSSTYEWQDLYIDGTANIDSLVADTADINGGTIDGITSLTAGGNLDIGAYSFRAQTFISDVATGTAPFTVSSTTAVSNLNADKLDGYDYSDITAAIAAVNSVPSGVILMWSGAVSAIPTGYVICDGNNGTPNLTDRFVIHADADSGGTRNVGDTGGASTHSHADTLAAPAHTHPVGSLVNTAEASHTHSLNTGADPSIVFLAESSGYDAATGAGSSHNHTISGSVGAATDTALTGSVTDGDNIPKYYALAYIMKT